MKSLRPRISRSVMSRGCTSSTIRYTVTPVIARNTRNQGDCLLMGIRVPSLYASHVHQLHLPLERPPGRTGFRDAMTILADDALLALDFQAPRRDVMIEPSHENAHGARKEI